MKIFRLILILALGLQIGFGADENGSSGSGQNAGNTNDEEHKYYLKYQSKTIVNDGECGVCDEVKEGFTALKYHEDFAKGITYCYVVKNTDMTTIVGYAHKQVKSCSYVNGKETKKIVDETKNTIEKSRKNNKSIESSIGKKTNNSNFNSSQTITFSKFMAGLLTLDPNIINRNNSVTGNIQLKDGVTIKGQQNVNVIKNSEVALRKVLNGSDTNLSNHTPDLTDTIKASVVSSGGETSFLYTEDINALDMFNQKNMGYFNDLFTAMEKIYQHLQVFIFVLIGGFFVMQIGASKLQAYLENRGESEGKQPYLHKFYIPLLMIGIFFMPIPEGNGHQSTVMQNMIRYFAQYSTTLADMANSVGEKVYIEKIFKSMGRISEQSFSALQNKKAAQADKVHKMNETIDKCNRSCCFGTYNGRERHIGSNFMESFSENFHNASKLTVDIAFGRGKAEEYLARKMASENQICEKKDGGFESCTFCESIKSNIAKEQKEFNNLQNEYRKVNYYVDNYSEVLKGLDTYFSLRNEEYGWIDVLLTPISSIFIETSLLGKFHKELSNNKSDGIVTKEEIARKSNALRYAKANGISFEEAEQIVAKSDISESIVGQIGGRLVWMMMPGASSVKTFLIGDGSANSEGVLTKFSDFAKTFLDFFTFGGGIVLKIINVPAVKALIDAGTTFVGYYITTVIMEMTFNMIPLLVISVAALVAFLSYLVTLCKYFYISPFVTAWAMATKKVDKIIDFLLAGIVIFFKPVLIVLFVYLSLFLYTLVDEFFIFVSIQQFQGIIVSDDTRLFKQIYELYGEGNSLLSSTFTGIYETITGATKEIKNFHIYFIIGAISGLLKIFGGLASSYVAWKLIVNGPSWALGMIGLDAKQDDMIASGIESNLARRAFVA